MKGLYVCELVWLKLEKGWRGDGFNWIVYECVNLKIKIWLWRYGIYYEYYFKRLIFWLCWRKKIWNCFDDFIFFII